MAKKASIKVRESIEELKNVLRKQSNIKSRQRLNALIESKKQPQRSRKELAQYLGIGKRTLETWLSIYKHEGIEGIIKVKPRRKGSKIITDEIHEALRQRVQSKDNPFLGYWDAHQWVTEKFGIEISYYWLRRYLIDRFGTKVKSTRKSHIKKDEQAVAFFKNAG